MSLTARSETCKAIVADAPRTIDYLDDECREHFEELQSLLNELDIPYEIDTGIVRGLDYYTKTVFEFVNEDGFTLCGGGRYDGLIHEIDEKQDIPSVGFGMGIERILYFLEREGVELPPQDPVASVCGYPWKQMPRPGHTSWSMRSAATVSLWRPITWIAASRPR